MDSSSSSSSELIPFNSNRADFEIVHPPSKKQKIVHPKHQVFISFRGCDVRDTFLSHLYRQLKEEKKLDVYKDDVDLQKGANISLLMKVIEVSEVYVVILSPNYADSSWCLEELVKIFECVETHKRMLIPVTYEMSFSEFENKLPSYAAAGVSEKWTDELRKILTLSGLDYKVVRPETKLIDEITKAVFKAIQGCSSSQMVDFSSYSASKGLVGMDRQIKEVSALVRKGDKSTITLGLGGMPGAGKTTLARTIFDLYSPQFEACYFSSPFAALNISQTAVFKQLLGDDGIGGTLPYELMLQRLRATKAFVVMDDVGNDVGDIVPLKNLYNAKYSDLFAPGSVVIVTSRNQQLLKNVCHHVYEVEGLDREEADELFCSCAFPENSVPTEYFELVERAVQYADGNPLAITILGANLRGKNPTFWDAELRALKLNPNPKLESIFKMSYDGLTSQEGDVFLDIACFYDHKQIRRPEVMEVMAMSLEGGSVNLIDNLVDKSLISITNDGIEMHGLLQDFGRSIVNKESKIKKRRRLWNPEDVRRLFQGNKGTQSIQGIFLNDGSERCDMFDIPADAFVKMDYLRFLVIRGHVTLPESKLKYLPNVLTIFEWPYFDAKYLPPQFSAKNLFVLDLNNSEIEQLWEDDDCNMVRPKIQLGNLESLKLGGSKKLKKLPDLSTAKRLGKIYLDGCESLEVLPTSILDLPKLDFLDVSGCMNINWNKLEGYIANRSGEQTSGILPNLTMLDLSQTPIQKVSSFITRLHILELFCRDCTELTEFPVIPTLEGLTLTGSLIKEVVELEKLKRLNLSNNKQLVLISGDCSKLKSLTRISLDGCSKLSRLPDSIGNLINLESLYLRYTAVTELPSSTGDLIGLFKLNLTDCKSLASLPDTMHNLPRLRKLVLDGCDQLTHLPQLPSSLKTLRADGCKSLQTLSVVEELFSERTNWLFGHCWKLDPVVCRKLVDKFVKNKFQARHYTSDSSLLLLPAKWDSESGGEEGRRVGSNNNPIASAKFLGQSVKPKLTIFCALLNPLDEGLKLEKDNNFRIECVMLKNKDRFGVEVIVSDCSLAYFPIYEDYQKEEHLSKGHFVVWSTTEDRFGGAIANEGSTLEFYFRGRYWINGELKTVPNLIKNCRVIPIYYDSRKVTYENEEEEEEVDDQSPNDLQGLYDRVLTNEDEEGEEDDDDQSPNDLQGLYDQLCAHC